MKAWLRKLRCIKASWSFSRTFADKAKNDCMPWPT